MKPSRLIPLRVVTLADTVVMSGLTDFAARSAMAVSRAACAGVPVKKGARSTSFQVSKAQVVPVRVVTCWASAVT